MAQQKRAAATAAPPTVTVCTGLVVTVSLRATLPLLVL